MRNNAHTEELSHRLERLRSSPIESIDTLLNSINNYFNNEIKITREYHQTTLMFLGIHAVALSIAEVFFNLTGLAGYKKFLEVFVDGNQKSENFSLVADKIHSWRNILAHQWISSEGYKIEYDYQAKDGWVIDDENCLTINPSMYLRQYILAFSSTGKIWDYERLFAEEEMKRIQERIIRKFI